MNKKPVLPGKYRHFKGNAYEALGIALHTETMEELVVYRALDGEEKLWARPAAMWNETVEKDGAPVRRFEPIERRVRLSLGEPVVIAQAPPLPSGQDHWGLFQFPTVERLPDGRLHCEYHIGKDSALAYGKPKGHAVSGDGGRSWQGCDFPGGGILLKNGGSLRCKIAEALTPEEAGLPSFPDAAVVCYGQTRALYRGERLDTRFRQFPFELTEPDGTVRNVLREVTIPDIAFFAGEGVVPRPMFTRLRRAPDGRLWAIGYPYCILPDRPAVCQAVFCVSDDEGESFSYLSRIEYQPDPLADPYYRVRGGFTEPDVGFVLHFNGVHKR